MTISDIIKDHPTATGTVYASADWMPDQAEANFAPKTLTLSAFTGAGAHGEYNDEIDALAAKFLTRELLDAADLEFDDGAGHFGAWYAEVEAETEPDANGVRLPITFSVWVFKAEPATVPVAECGFADDLADDLAKGHIKAHASAGVVDPVSKCVLVAIKLGQDGAVAITTGIRFAESDWEECGRLEAYDPDMNDPIDRAAVELL